MTEAVDETVGRTVVGTSTGPEAEAAAALVWARATARRDGGRPRDAVETLPGIRDRLALPDAALLLARRADVVVGFAVTAPREEALELFYLAVDPDAWGLGAGSSLLRAVDHHARRSGRTSLELWVIASNERAVALYERAGWTPTGDRHTDARGVVETRLVRRLTG